MPIYAYKCASCGFAKDTLQKISDPPLTVCPQCGASTFSKQVTAAGFQLKGSGWYVTDFRNGSSKAAEKSTDKPADKPADSPAGAPAESAAKPDTPKTESKPATPPASGGGSSTTGS